MRTGILPGPLSNPLSVLVIGLGAVLARVWRACRLQTGSCFDESMAGVPTTDWKLFWQEYGRRADHRLAAELAQSRKRNSARPS